jgi:hypothetical protein
MVVATAEISWMQRGRADYSRWLGIGLQASGWAAYGAAADDAFWVRAVAGVMAGSGMGLGFWDVLQSPALANCAPPSAGRRRIARLGSMGMPIAVIGLVWMLSLEPPVKMFATGLAAGMAMGTLAGMPGRDGLDDGGP